MAVGATAAKLHLSSAAAAARRPSLLHLAAVAVLCSLSYLFGIWHHGGFSAGPAAGGATSSSSVSIATAVSCASPALTTAPSSPPAGPLDFAAHHTAEGMESEAALRQRSYEACPAKYSEYTPCEDVERSLRFPRDRLVYRERHCPADGERLRCLVPAPRGYRNPFPWPASRDVAWFANVPHKELSVEKAVQNWIRVDGDRFRFPGGGTMFPRGAGAYIDDIAKLIPLHDGSIRTALDTGCGVASWGAYLLSRDILAMSFAPRDSHEAQVQFALERGVPAMIGVLASNRLTYPARSFDMAHCSRCLIPWQLYDGLYLIEVDRILRPGGYWILSGPPINWKKHWKGWDRTKEDLDAEQKAIEAVARSLCWKKIKEAGDIAIWQKPTNHIHCKAIHKVSKSIPFCSNQNPDAAWYDKMEACITRLPEVSDLKEVAGGALKKWPERLTAVPPRIASGSIEGVTEEMFVEDTELWKKRVGHYKSVIAQLGQKGRYRNLLDMNAKFGGFAAALVNDPLWVMNMVPTVGNSTTLGAIYERGLIGSYQDWCEGMSTYPRTYDLIHADSLFTLYNGRCEADNILLEMDRILRPEGTVIIRDDVDMLVKIKSITDGMRWNSQIVDHEDGPLVREKLLLAVKTYWTLDDSKQ
ncbi:probable methyltransferase PMT15 [Zea mays]|uniref:Methyltransferase n=1 Tax=Zea mays TaxID=4577 RepID=K7TVN3_MAIZE|nr:probable methyltransferase PMT15 [Zea mays]AQK45444.1 putative methyltransferase PMT15 [Zea mays]|eukprot:XP_008663475.1 probable methyltransferase PMT15 [Zea mays]